MYQHNIIIVKDSFNSNNPDFKKLTKNKNNKQAAIKKKIHN